MYVFVDGWERGMCVYCYENFEIKGKLILFVINVKYVMYIFVI